MPRNPGNLRVETLLSPAQYAALRAWAESLDEGLGDAEALRLALLEVVPGFDLDPILPRGKHLRPGKTPGFHKKKVD